MTITCLDNALLEEAIIEHEGIVNSVFVGKLDVCISVDGVKANISVAKSNKPLTHPFGLPVHLSTMIVIRLICPDALKNSCRSYGLVE